MIFFSFFSEGLISTNAGGNKGCLMAIMLSLPACWAKIINVFLLFGGFTTSYSMDSDEESQLSNGFKGIEGLPEEPFFCKRCICPQAEVDRVNRERYVSGKAKSLLPES